MEWYIYLLQFQTFSNWPLLYGFVSMNYVSLSSRSLLFTSIFSDHVNAVGMLHCGASQYPQRGRGRSVALRSSQDLISRALAAFLAVAGGHPLRVLLQLGTWSGCALAQALGVLPRWMTRVSAHVASALMTAMSL